MFGDVAVRNAPAVVAVEHAKGECGDSEEIRRRVRFVQIVLSETSAMRKPATWDVLCAGWDVVCMSPLKRILIALARSGREFSTSFCRSGASSNQASGGWPNSGKF